MFKDKFVFSQIVSFLDRNKFNHIVRKYGGDKYVKHFTCWNQLLCLMFGQLSNRASLRDLIVVLEAHRGKLYHLGLGKNVSKTTLAKSNQERDYRIFEEYAYFLVDEAQRKRATDIFKLGGNVYAFDYNDFKSLYHIHLVEAKFVVRAKKNLKFKTFKWKRKLPKNVLSDAIVELTGYYPQKHYPEQFRIVRYWDEEQEREFVFITNAMDISALQVAELYKNRWKIELFFYDKYIVMRSDQKSTINYQYDRRILLRSTSHNEDYFFSPLSQSLRFLLPSQDLSESRLGVRFIYAFSRASRFAFESARA